MCMLLVFPLDIDLVQSFAIGPSQCDTKSDVYHGGYAVARHGMAWQEQDLLDDYLFRGY